MQQVLISSDYIAMSTISCTPSTFASLSIPAATIQDITTTAVLNYTTQPQEFVNPNYGPLPATKVDFCNVTVLHTHNGNNESIVTQIWLPIGSWNGRLQGIGGGGFIAGLFGYMFLAFEGAIAEGYAAIGSNAGIYGVEINGEDAHTWALPETGRVDMHKVEDFAYRGLADMPGIGKDVVKLFYGKKPQYSYFSGCSNGGRQGYVFAQKYPTAFDGIAACAPGIYWDQFFPELFWPQLLMNHENAYPWPCELEYLRNAALKACDTIDGVEDGVLQDPEACTFDPGFLRNTSIDCPAAGGSMPISDIAIRIAQATWRDERMKGINWQMHTTGYDADFSAVANTTCANVICSGNPHPLTVSWMRTFLQKDMSWDYKTLTTYSEFEAMRTQSVHEYESVIGISSYNLSGFREAGGKMITFHGMADPLVSYKNTQKFYEAVEKEDPSVHDYYRLFMAPGLGHGIGGRGAYPHTTFHALVDWVEHGKAPETLEATSQPDASNKTINRRLCAYPKKSKYNGVGNTNDFASWVCV